MKAAELPRIVSSPLAMETGTIDRSAIAFYRLPRHSAISDSGVAVGQNTSVHQSLTILPPTKRYQLINYVPLNPSTECNLVVFGDNPTPQHCCIYPDTCGVELRGSLENPQIARQLALR